MSTDTLSFVSGYTGVNCETDIDDCVGNQCKYNSTCVDLVQGYRCECLPGYSGVRCTDRLGMLTSRIAFDAISFVLFIVHIEYYDMDFY